MFSAARLVQIDHWIEKEDDELFIIYFLQIITKTSSLMVL